MTADLSLLQIDGRLLATEDPAERGRIGQVMAGPYLAMVLRGTAFREVHYSGDLNADVADIFVPVFDEDSESVLGVIRLTQELSTVYARFLRVRSIVIWVLAPGLLFGIVIWVAVATVMGRPLLALTCGISQIANAEEMLTDEPEDVLLTETGPSEVRLLTRSFNHMIMHLHDLEVDRRHLLANLLHELGRPLGALRSATDALLGGATEDADLCQTLLTGMDAEHQRLQRLLDDLAELADQGSAHQLLVRRPTAMTAWLHTTLSAWRMEVQHQGIHWQEDLPDGLPVLAVDPDRLGQALGNLLSNAIKYTPKGETIRLAAQTTTTHLCIRVEDTGPGIAFKEQSQIFEPFYRGRASGGQGLGVGLTIARDSCARPRRLPDRREPPCPRQLLHPLPAARRRLTPLRPASPHFPIDDIPYLGFP